MLDGAVRRSGNTIRVTVQLADANAGTQLWAETYNRNLDDSDIFAVQDELTDYIVAVVADNSGVLLRAMEAECKRKPEQELTATDCVVLSFAFVQRFKLDEHAWLRALLERMVQRESNHSNLWAALALLYFDEAAFGFNIESGASDRALDAARRAVELDRVNPIAYQALAQTHFIRRELTSFRTAAEKAISLNPRDTLVLAILGIMLGLTGEFERGADLAERAVRLNPHHAGWYHFAAIWNYFHKRDYEKALEHANKMDNPHLFWQPLVRAALCGHLGRDAVAKIALKDLLELNPDFASQAREMIEAWHYASGDAEHLLEGLYKAGLRKDEAEG